MKTIKRNSKSAALVAVVMLLAAFAVTPVLAQNAPATFEIAKPFRKTTYDGKSFKELRSSGVSITRDILAPINDPQVNKHLRRYKAAIGMEYLLLFVSPVAAIGTAIGAGSAYKKAIKSYNHAVEQAAASRANNPELK